MKFLCSNCKAKYQISDDKVVGRTLRMTCRRCQNEIVIRSGPPGQSNAPSALPPPPASRSSVLGADFRSQVVAGPSMMAAAARVDEWHVAINDIPVGPMRREEVARKFQLGAASGDSLAWREGMDDWLPVRNIPELHALLVAQRPPPPPPSAAYAPAAGMPQQHMLQPAMPIGMLQQTQPLAPAQAMMRADVAPVGGRVGMGFETVEEVQMPQSQMPMQGQGGSYVGPPPQAPARGFGIGPLFLMLCAGALFVALGILLGLKVLNPPQQVAVAAPAAPVAAPVAAPAPEAAPEEHVVELGVQEIEGEEGKARAGGTGTKPSDTGTTAGGKKLSAEQQAMLARMGGSFDSTATLKTETAGAARGGHASGEGLSAQELSAVVLQGRKNLQRCYETALRGSQSDETVRLDVEISVAPSGNVSGVNVSGKGLPGMDVCIQRIVKGWRFPQSGDLTQTKFPVVFQPGA